MEMMEDARDKADRVGGLGFEKKQKGEIHEINEKGKNIKINLNSLEGANMDDLKYLD